MAAKFPRMLSSLLESVIVREFPERKADSSLDLTRATYSINRLRWEKKMSLCELAPAISVHMKK
jgi:hypothetical protein